MKINFPLSYPWIWQATRRSLLGELITRRTADLILPLVIIKEFILPFYRAYSLFHYEVTFPFGLTVLLSSPHEISLSSLCNFTVQTRNAKKEVKCLNVLIKADLKLLLVLIILELSFLCDNFNFLETFILFWNKTHELFITKLKSFALSYRFNVRRL
jgi:hypothetical protein